MGQPISLFTKYHSAENTLTNYCGLILKLLYEESPLGFQDVISNLTNGASAVLVNPQFNQQKGKDANVFDLFIEQQSYTILFEAKRYDWFEETQIIPYVESIAKRKDVNVLFLVLPEEMIDFEKRFQKALFIAKEANVIIKPVTFEQLTINIGNLSLSASFKRYLSEFKVFLDLNDYLPSWKYLLEVVNCGGTMNEVENGFYMCPDSGGSYNHRRAKYFGPYANKQVDKIFEISGLVVIHKDKSSFEPKWNNGKDTDEQLIQKAILRTALWEQKRLDENSKVDLQMFILENPSDTSFKKTSPGGMLQSKKYFWDIAKGLLNSQQLADKLKNETWEQILSVSDHIKDSD